MKGWGIMFKKIASDALGLSDIGKIIGPEGYDKTQADDYVRHEDNEVIFFLIATKADEYCFTNLALIHIDGNSALSSKKVMRRYPYYQHNISDVLLETAGKIDLDVEIKFNLGGVPVSIDVDRREVEKLKELYKALLFMSEEMLENGEKLHHAQTSLTNSYNLFQRVDVKDKPLLDEFKKINEYGFSWLESSRNTYRLKDYGYAFEKYIL